MMKKLLLTLLLMLPLCGSGEFDRVSFPVLFADAQMPLYACLLHIDDNDRFHDVVLIFAGEPKHKRGSTYKGLGLIKAMLPHEFIEALYPERGDE